MIMLPSLELAAMSSVEERSMAASWWKEEDAAAPATARRRQGSARVNISKVRVRTLTGLMVRELV